MNERQRRLSVSDVGTVKEIEEENKTAVDTKRGNWVDEKMFFDRFRPQFLQKFKISFEIRQNFHNNLIHFLLLGREQESARTYRCRR